MKMGPGFVAIYIDVVANLVEKLLGRLMDQETVLESLGKLVVFATALIFGNGWVISRHIIYYFMLNKFYLSSIIMIKIIRNRSSN